MLLNIKLILFFYFFLHLSENAFSQYLPDQMIYLTSDSVLITGKQSSNDQLPGAGLVRVKDKVGKYSDFTLGINSAIVRTNNPIFEFFIGDNPTDIGTLSIRRNYHDNTSLGSRLLIWDRDNIGNLELSAANLHNGIAEIKLNSIQNNSLLNIVNDQQSGTIEIKVGSNVVGKFNEFGMQLKAYTSQERDILTNVPIGTTIFNSSEGLNQVWNGSIWN